MTSTLLSDDGIAPSPSGGSVPQRLWNWVGSVGDSVFRAEQIPRRGIAWSFAPLAVLVVAVAVALTRMGSGIGTVWGEDGIVFFQQQHDTGYWANLLQGYQGYMHLVPRTLALVADQVPLRDVAFALSTGAAAVTGLCTALISRALPAYGLGRLPSLPTAILLPASFIGLYECLDVICNIQWFLACGAFWALIWRPSEKRWIAASSVLAFVTIASAPLTLVFAPLVLVRLALCRGRDRLVALAFLAGAVLQGSAMLTTPRTISGGAVAAPELLQTAGYRLFTVSVFGVTTTGDLYNRHRLILGLVALAMWLLVVMACLRCQASRRLLAVVVVVATALFGIGAVQNFASIDFPGNDMLDLFDTGRYAVSPGVILIIGSLCALATAWRVRRSRLTGLTIGILVVALGIATVRDYTYAIPRDAFVGWSTSLDEAQRMCRTHPGAVASISDAPISYGVKLSCADVLAHT